MLSVEPQLVAFGSFFNNISPLLLAYQSLGGQVLEHKTLLTTLFMKNKYFFRSQ